MDPLPYTSLPSPPPTLDGPGVLARLVDGLGFRYRWATEGLGDGDLDFRPSSGAMTLGEVLAHMNLLLRWVEGHVRGTLDGQPDDLDDGFAVTSETWPEVRADTLERLVHLRALFLESGAEHLARVTITGTPSKGPQPFWSVINGPLADFLTHVGQVSSWRRINGNPAPRVDVFRGRAQRD